MSNRRIGRGQTTQGVCNSCTRRVIYTAYQRAPWLRLIREPLRIGMLLMGWWHGIDPKSYEVPTEFCVGCLRWTKTGLLERSTTFRWLNRLVDPHFMRLVWLVVTPEERAEAKRFAVQATQTEEGVQGNIPLVVHVSERIPPLEA